MLVNRSFWLIVSLNEDGRIAVVQAEEWESRIIFVPVCDPSFSVEWNPKPPEPPLNLGWMIRLARRSRSFQRSGTWSRSFQWPRSGSQTQLKQSSHIALIAFISNLESYCIYSRRILSPCRNKTTAFAAPALGFVHHMTRNGNWWKLRETLLKRVICSWQKNLIVKKQETVSWSYHKTFCDVSRKSFLRKTRNDCWF